MDRPSSSSPWSSRSQPSPSSASSASGCGSSTSSRRRTWRARPPATPAIHSSEAVCPTSSWRDPQAPPQTYRPFPLHCDGPANPHDPYAWPRMTDHARRYVWATDPARVFVNACWSGYRRAGSDPSANADWPATESDGAGGVLLNSFDQCTISGLDPTTQAGALGCGEGMTIPGRRLRQRRPGQPGDGLRVLRVVPAVGRLPRHPRERRHEGRRDGGHPRPAMNAHRRSHSDPTGRSRAGPPDLRGGAGRHPRHHGPRRRRGLRLHAPAPRAERSRSRGTGRGAIHPDRGPRQDVGRGVLLCPPERVPPQRAPTTARPATRAGWSMTPR